jgi:hypothetical protein
MSIQIGTTPIYQPTDTIIEVQSNRSNVMRLNSTSDQVYINTGDFQIGQTSNANEYFFLIKDTLADTEIAKFSKDFISLLKPINALQAIELTNSLIVNSNFFAQDCATCNLTIQNDQTGLPVMTFTTNGDAFIHGNVAIGMALTSNYELAVASNAYIGQTLFTSNLYTNAIAHSPNGISQFTLTSNIMSLTADVVEITNLSILGLSSFETLKVTGKTELDGPAYASNVTLTNRSTTETAFTIQQRRLDNQFGDLISGVPISVLSDFETFTGSRILQVSPYGHLVMGGVVTANDHLITARIQGFRDAYFGGFMNFTNSNANLDSFTVNKNANLSIGNPTSSAMFEVRNNYAGNEQYYSKPSTLIQLQNTNANNLLPILNYKLPNNSTRLQITSNAGLVFHNTPIDLHKFDIETSNAGFIAALETNSIKGHYTSNIDVNMSSFNRVNDIQAESATLSNVYIYTLTVDDIITDSLACFETLNDPEELRILSTRCLINSSNVVINRSGAFFSSNETSNLSGDTFRIYTSPNTTLDTVHALHSIGTNADISNRITNNNTIVNSKASISLAANQNIFKIGVINKSATPGNNASMYIGPFSTDDAGSGFNTNTAAINIDKNKVIKFGNNIHIDPTGYLTIGRDANQSPLAARLYVKGNMQAVTTSDLPSFTIASDNPLVGVNTSVPTSNFHVHNGTVLMTTNSGNSTAFSIYDNCVGIGTRTGSPFQVSLRSTFTNEVSFSSNVSISGRLDTLGNVASTSDKAIKTDLVTIQNSLDKIEQLNGYLYRRIDTGERETGLLAQEVKEVLPEAVHQATNGMYSLAYGNMAGLFVEAIKELKTRITKIEEHLQLY